MEGLKWGYWDEEEQHNAPHIDCSCLSFISGGLLPSVVLNSIRIARQNDIFKWKDGYNREGSFF